MNRTIWRLKRVGATLQKGNIRAIRAACKELNAVYHGEFGHLRELLTMAEQANDKDFSEYVHNYKNKVHKWWDSQYPTRKSNQQEDPDR